MKTSFNSNAMIIKEEIGIYFLIFLIAFLVPSELLGEGKCIVLDQPNAISIALERNPLISSLRHEIQGQKALVEPSGSLPDPILGIGILNLPTDTFTIDQEAMTQTQVKLTQKLPFPGKLSLKQTIQELRAKIMEWRLKGATLNLKRDVSSILWELFRIDGRLILLKKEESTLKKIIELSTSKYAAGKGLQSDVLLAQLELTKLLNKKIDLESLYKDSLHKLKAYLSLDRECVDIKRDYDLTLSKLPPLAELIQLALEENPGIRELETLLELKQQSYELTKKSLYPDFALIGAYGKRFGDNPDGSDRADFATFMFTLNVPIFYKKKQSLNIVAALEDSRAIQGRLDAKKDQVRETLRGKYAVYEGLLDEDRLYSKTMIPKARATLEALKAAYTQGRADILGLLRAELMLYKFEEAHIDIVSKANKVRAAIEALVGRDL